MIGISLSGITKSFGQTAVLNGINLDIKDGEFLTLVGPSGCGKSTLLRILAGLEAPDSGQILINDKIVNNVRAAERNLAMVFQSYALYPHLKVSENMMTPLKMRDLSARERWPIIGPMLARSKYLDLYRQVEEVANTLKISDLLDRKPGQLSGGQRQRVALGRAMVRKPVAFLMDEPLSNLDAALRVHMRFELAQLHRSLGTTFVYVTHDQAEALTMSTRMAVMMEGNILQFDRPEVVYNNPLDIRVAEFVGSPKINRLAAEIDGQGRLTCLGRAMKRKLPISSRGPAILAIRPEHLQVTESNEAGSWTGTVHHLENMGSDIFLHLILDSSGEKVVVRSTAGEVFPSLLGAKVHFSPRPGTEMVFAPDGVRIQFEDALSVDELLPQRVAV